MTATTIAAEAVGYTEMQVCDLVYIQEATVTYQKGK